MRIYIQAFPRSAKNELIKISEGEYKARLTAPPARGEANAQLVKVLAEHFSVPKSCVSISGGKSARKKIVDIIA